MTHRDDPPDAREPREKLRTGEEVYHQIRWDARLDPAEFVIGYEDRGAGVEEIPFSSFVPGGDIPWHRIRHYRRGPEIVWDRGERIDRLPGNRARPAERGPGLASRPVHQSALAIVPPLEVWPAIQAIRSQHDRHVDRWMPHINLLYGFLPEEHFLAAEGRMASALCAVPVFTVTLSDFDRFDHRSSATVWLRPRAEPEGAIERLQATLESLFPQCNEQSRVSARGFTPHLSVAQFRGAAEAEAHVAGWQRTFAPIVFPVRAVQLLSRRGEEPFSVRAEVPLGEG